MKINSIVDLLQHFNNEKTCIKHLELILWKDSPRCPHCKHYFPYKTKVGWKCSNQKCKKKFNVKTNTIFQNTRIPLNKWFLAMFLLISQNKGINSVSLSKSLGITQKSAWFLLHKIRIMMERKDKLILGLNDYVEVDEVYLGGIDKFKHFNKKRIKNTNLTREGKAFKKKSIIVGIIERKGKVVLDLVPNTTSKTLVKFIGDNVKKGSVVCTDELRGYKPLKKLYQHKTVTHGKMKFVEGNIHTNSIENFWRILKTGIKATYSYPKDKYLRLYLTEFAEKFNSRDLLIIDRINLFISRSNKYVSHKAITS